MTAKQKQTFFQAAEANWPEDEAYGLWYEWVREMTAPDEEAIDRAISHIFKVFERESDAEDLKRRFAAKLAKLRTRGDNP